MIRPRDRKRAANLETALVNFSKNVQHLPGIDSSLHREVLIAQIIESERRQLYIDHIRLNGGDGSTVHPHNISFNPLHAAVYHSKYGNFDEACWIIFLATHFGKNSKTKWELCRKFYGRIDTTPIWNWDTAKTNQALLADWVTENASDLKNYGFGNHRKYESIDSQSMGLRRVLASYFSVFENDHKWSFDAAINGTNDPSVRFDALYKLFSQVFRFGRLACFDHVAMVCRLGLESSVPGSTYLKSATGPKRGAALLINNDADDFPDIRGVELTLSALGGAITVDAQVIEDSLCNWQKSPDMFKAFR